MSQRNNGESESVSFNEPKPLIGMYYPRERTFAFDGITFTEENLQRMKRFRDTPGPEAGDMALAYDTLLDIIKQIDFDEV